MKKLMLVLAGALAVAIPSTAFVVVALAYLEDRLESGDVIMTPPTNDKLFSIIFRGLGQTETELLTDAVATGTPEAAFTTDLTTAQQNDSYTQEVLIRNISSDFGGTADVLCVKGIPWATAGATCTLKCASVAATFTCSGAATDGKHVPAGGELNRTFDGTNCVCVAGNAAATEFQSERILR